MAGCSFRVMAGGRHVCAVGVGLLLALVTSMGMTSTASATFPGANGRIAFDTNRRTTTINTVLPDGTGQRAIIRGVEPAWSPNGRRFAFEQRGTIFMSAANGSHVRQLTSGPEHNSLPSYSPSGKRIVFERENEADAFTILTMRSDGTHKRRIASGEDAIYSPVHNAIAYSPRAPAAGIWIMRPDGSHKRRLTQHGGPWDFSPDGRRILTFDRNETAYTVSVKTGRLHRLGPCVGLDASFSPDGTKLLTVHAHQTQRDFWLTLDTTPADGTCPAKTLLNTRHSLFFPAWQPLPNG